MESKKLNQFFANFLVAAFLVIFLYPEPISKLQHMVFANTAKTMTITLLPEKNVNSKDYEVWIYSIKINGTELPLSNVQLSKGWEYRDKKKYGYATDCIISTTPGSVLTLSNISSNTTIGFYKHLFSGKVAVAVDDNINQTIDLFSQNYSTYTLDMTKQINTLNTMPKLIFSILMYIVAFITGILFIYFLENDFFRRKLQTILSILNKDANKLYCFIFFVVIIFSFIFIIYKIGVPNLIAIGTDQAYYWNVGQNFFLNGKMSIHNYAQSAVSFRGYIMPLVLALIQKLSFNLGINAYLTYSVLTAIMFSSLYSFALPIIYEIFSGKKSNYLQVFLFAGLTSIFWVGYYIYLLLDFWALTFFSFSFIFMLKGLDQKKNYLISVAGMFISLAILSRGNYVIALYCMIVYIFYCVWKENYFQLYKEKECLSFKYTIRSIKIKHYLLITQKIIFLLIGVIVICFPQLLINMDKGHISLFPYDTKGVWMTKDQTLNEFAAQQSFTYIQGYPFPLQDKQSQSIVQGKFDLNNLTDNESKHLNIADYANILLEKPVDMLTIYLRKVFLFLDTKTFITYPKGHLGKYAERIYSMANYSVWILFAWYMSTVYNKTHRRRGESFYVFIMAFALTLNYVAIQVEWRYFITLYVLAYYMIAYPLLDYLKNKDVGKVFQMKNVVLFVTFQITLFMISNSLYYNM